MSTVLRAPAKDNWTKNRGTDIICDCDEDVLLQILPAQMKGLNPQTTMTPERTFQSLKLKRGEVMVIFSCDEPIALHDIELDEKAMLLVFQTSVACRDRLAEFLGVVAWQNMPQYGILDLNDSELIIPMLSIRQLTFCSGEHLHLRAWLWFITGAVVTRASKRNKLQTLKTKSPRLAGAEEQPKKRRSGGSKVSQRTRSKTKNKL